MRQKVILVLLDGLCEQVARECMGSLGAWLKAYKGVWLGVQSELPSLSRPLYECLLTGAAPVESGVLHNGIVRRSNQQSIFALARSQGRITAASAYHWVSELYNHAPFDPVNDRLLDCPECDIQHGVFYQWDDYPDEAVFLDAEMLRRRHDPDFLLIHPMNIDDTGHHYGSDSAQYRNVVRRDDIYLSYFLGSWLQAGYQVIVTADHGMNRDGTHGGLLEEERRVPLVLLGNAFNPDCKAKVAQTEICGLCCELLGLEHHKPFPGGVLNG